MIEAIIIALIWICIAALVLWLVIYVLRTVIGWQVPTKIEQIVWVIFALIALLWLLRAVLPGFGVALP